ncbi:MAG: hypothetical protein RBU21_16575 [FCB group bacterium]|jgi:hypothetical protein|nr:hypothetical protein [FCB group bacterium]
MATSHYDQPSNVERLEEEYRRQEMLVEHIRALLTRADSKRESDPENRRKWNRILDNLENALTEAKTKLDHCDMCLRREREWGHVVEQSNPVAPAPEPYLADPAEFTVDDAEAVADSIEDDMQAAEAARTLLASPLEAVQEASLEQVALAQQYLARRNDEGASNGTDRRLAGRVELAIQGRIAVQQKPVVLRNSEERRQQRVLREIVGKIQRHRMGTLTIQELELAVDCCIVLSQRIDLTEAELRLREILLRGLQEADRLVNRLRDRAGLRL